MMTRRHILQAAFASAAAAVIAACTGKTRIATNPTPTATVAPTATTTPIATTTAVPSCVVKPALTEGPYFVDEKLDRSDIREDRKGTKLRLTFNVSRISGAACTALQSAQVDVWHCDAGGVYSDVGQSNSIGKKFLRGYQLTDASGTAEFTTIFPGWYTGRAIHIHFKIRTGLNEFTSQLFFGDSTIDAILATAPYKHRGSPNTRNANDGIYASGGSRMIPAVETEGSGYSAAFDIGLQI
jgi:protocatechuate 3,4-dioxygenase beta subunit